MAAQTHEIQTDPPPSFYACEDCDWTGSTQDMDPINDVHERVSVGEIMAAGQCPACGALIGCADQDIPQYTLESCVRVLLERALVVLMDGPESPAQTGSDMAMFGTARSLMDAYFSGEQFAGIPSPLQCISQLSDAQELLASAKPCDEHQRMAFERVRQGINRAKYGIANFCVAGSPKMSEVR